MYIFNILNEVRATYYSLLVVISEQYSFVIWHAFILQTITALTVPSKLFCTRRSQQWRPSKQTAAG